MVVGVVLMEMIRLERVVFSRKELLERLGLEGELESVFSTYGGKVEFVVVRKDE